MRHRRSSLALCSIVALSLALAACGQSSNDLGKGPSIGQKGSESTAAQQLGFPQFATKNTTRVGGADATADATADPADGPADRPD